MRWSVLLWIPTVSSLVVGFNKKKRARRLASSPPPPPPPPKKDPPPKPQSPPPPEKKKTDGNKPAAAAGAAAAKEAAPASKDSTLKPLVLAPRVLNLNIMVAGLSGLGKTTAVNALFRAWTGTKAKAPPSTQQSWFYEIPTSSVDTSRVFEKYDKKNNVLFRVTIVDTPGFGNNIDNGEAVSPIAKYVAGCRMRQFVKGQETEEEGSEELVHACVYFMSPHRFLEIDRFFLKNVQNELPVIPVIAKSDTLTNEELRAYRKHLKSQFKKEDIQTYSFGNSTSKAGPRSRNADDCLAIVARDGSYPWGVSKVHDADHSDFDTLRDNLLSEHTEKLIQIAKAKYGVFRSQKHQNMRRLAVIKTVAIVGFCTHSLATRTTLFPFLEDFTRWFWKYFSAGPNSPRKRVKKITRAVTGKTISEDTPRYLVGPFLANPNN